MRTHAAPSASRCTKDFDSKREIYRGANTAYGPVADGLRSVSIWVMGRFLCTRFSPDGEVLREEEYVRSVEIYFFSRNTSPSGL